MALVLLRAGPQTATFTASPRTTGQPAKLDPNSC